MASKLYCGRNHRTRRMAENNPEHEKAQADPTAFVAEILADAAAEQERRKAAANSKVAPIELPKRPVRTEPKIVAISKAAREDYLAEKKVAAKPKRFLLDGVLRFERGARKDGR